MLSSLSFYVISHSSSNDSKETPQALHSMMFHQVSSHIVQNYVKWKDCRELEVVERDETIIVPFCNWRRKALSISLQWWSTETWRCPPTKTILLPFETRHLFCLYSNLLIDGRVKFNYNNRIYIRLWSVLFWSED